MSPITLDLTSDFDPAITTGGGSSSQPRTLLVAPPSVASHEERISALFTTYPRDTTDLHMLDRLVAGLVTLPTSTYDLILVLTDPDGSRHAEASALLSNRAVWALLVPALKAGGKLRSEDGTLGTTSATPEAREAVLAGLVAGPDGFTKPDYAEEEAVPLRFGLKRKNNPNAVNSAVAPIQPAAQVVTAAPAGVGFVTLDLDDDLDLDGQDDDDVIDEDTLLTEADLRRPIQQPPECQPKPGKKRRACKDCTCGLAERLEAEDKARRDKADQALNTLKLKSEDLLELDLTVPGKTGSCGSCALGDAFRCDGCPYTGLPPFKVGEEVSILNNVPQL
ncbi:electron carrier [Neurospora sp. IMI 360204]|nr:electron carrier [Neurospora sp. IMI 360204]